MKKFLAILLYSLVFLLPVVASAVTYKCPDGKNSFNAAGTQVCTNSKDQVYGYFDTKGSYIQSSQNQSGSQTSSVSPNSGGNLTYTPLEPLPGVNLTTSGGGVDLESLINSLFKILLALGAMTAVAMLVFSGVTYMVSDVVNKKDEARKRIQNAVFGLLLLIGAYLILNTINPQLVNFVNPAPAAPNVSSTQPPSSGGGSTNSGPGTIGGSYTNYGWYIVGNTNMAVLCNQAVGPGWVTVDSNQCKAPKPSSGGTSYVYGCCGYNPKYTPPAPPAPPEDSPPLPPGESDVYQTGKLSTLSAALRQAVKNAVCASPINCTVDDIYAVVSNAAVLAKDPAAVNPIKEFIVSCMNKSGSPVPFDGKLINGGGYLGYTCVHTTNQGPQG